MFLGIGALAGDITQLTALQTEVGVKNEGTG